MGWIARRLGDSARGLDLARQALAIREAFDDRQGIATSLGSLSQVYQAAGNYRAALDALGRSLELRTSIGAVHAIAEALINIAVVYEAQGDYAQAAAYLRRALALNQSKVGSTSLTAEIHTHLGDVLFLAGRLRACCAVAEAEPRHQHERRVTRLKPRPPGCPWRAFT